MVINSFRSCFLTVVFKGSSRPSRSEKHREQGLTLIECLVAIIMVGLVGSSIAPALVISVATRVQSQRSEQALRLAQSEIERVRRLVERGEATAANLPPVAPYTATFTNDTQLDQVLGPRAANGIGLFGNNDPFRAMAPNDVVNRTGGDFAVQVFRSPGLEVDGVPVAFGIGVRIYDANALRNAPAGQNLPTNPASLRMVGGEGDRRTRPLASLYTNVVSSDTSESLCNYFIYLRSTLPAAERGSVTLPVNCEAAPAP